MRIRNAVVIILVALASAVTFSITGQEEPLPVVRAKGATGSTDEATPAADPSNAWRSEPAIYLAVDPIHEPPPITLADAARNNDYVTFHELYVRAQNRGEDVSQYQTLHELWSWAIADPIGAFYGRELYDRLARAYPGYAAYIDEFRLIDRRGNVFFPTAETRAFLLERATRGEVPRVMLAVAEEDPQTALPKVTAAAQPRVAAPALGRRVVPQAGDRVEAPARVSTAAAQRPAAEAAAATQEPVTELAPMAPPITIVSTPAPIVAPQQQVVQQEPVAAVVPESSNEMRNRGILLLIIGLLGTGILAVILRAPREQADSILDFSEKVHPIRKQASPHADEHRATGSRG